MELFGIFNNPTKQFPGPGNYKLASQLSDTKYSFRPRTKDPNTFSTAINNPGPGAYPYYRTINKEGKYHFSKYENSKASVFHPAHSERFPKSIITSIRIISKLKSWTRSLQSLGNCYESNWIL